MRFERLADAVFQGCIPQQAHGHHHEQRHDAFGLFEIERRSERSGLSSIDSRVPPALGLGT
jgi:hypothetical protein